MKFKLPVYHLGALLIGVPLTLKCMFPTGLNGSMESLITSQPMIAVLIGNLAVAMMFRERLRNASMPRSVPLYLGIGLVNFAIVSLLGFGPLGLIYAPVVMMEIWWLFIPACLVAGVLMRHADVFDRRLAPNA